MYPEKMWAWGSIGKQSFVPAGNSKGLYYTLGGPTRKELLAVNASFCANGFVFADKSSIWFPEPLRNAEANIEVLRF